MKIRLDVNQTQNFFFHIFEIKRSMSSLLICSVSKFLVSTYRYILLSFVECMGGARDRRSRSDRFMHDTSGFDLQRARRELKEHTIRNKTQPENSEIHKPSYNDRHWSRKLGGWHGESEPSGQKDPVRLSRNCRAMASGVGFRQGRPPDRWNEKVHVRGRKIRRRAVLLASSWPRLRYQRGWRLRSRLCARREYQEIRASDRERVGLEVGSLYQAAF